MRRFGTTARAGVFACVAILAAGCASTITDTQRYERALDRVERESIDKYCTRHHYFVRVRLDGATAVEGTADDAKHACVATLAGKADRPDQRTARVRMLRCMRDAGWVIAEPPAGPADAPVELGVCLSERVRSRQEPLVIAGTGTTR